MRVPLVVVLALSMGACVGTTSVSAGYVADQPSSYSPSYTGGSGVSADVSLDLFQSELAPYGQWVSASSYGSCWQPSQNIVGYEFEPYATGGSWAWSDAGWQFESDLPFAWATFHYGRWLNDPQVGWCWAPGTEWAPSWVDWRYGDGYVGWAPLPPDNWAYRSRYQPQWVFVDAPHFVARDAWRYRMRDYHRAYTVTQPVAPSAGTRYRVGPPPQQITQYIGRPVPTAPVARGRPSPGENRPWTRRPEVQQPAPAPTPVQPPAAPQPPPSRFNPTTPPERHRGWEQQPQVQPQPPAAPPPQPPSATPPPAAQPPPVAPGSRFDRGQGRNEPPGTRPWERERERQPPPGPPIMATPPQPQPPAAPPPRAMPQPPVASPPQGMPPAPPQPRPPEAHGPPAGVPPAAPPAQARPPPAEKRRGPPEKKDAEERKEEQRRQRD